MSNVLVIEPRKILQHATAIALFPEHEARIVDAIPEAAVLRECDAVIVDAVTLREANALSAQTLSAMEQWTSPVVWIDGDAPRAPNCANLVIVKRPVSRDELRAALATCLGRELMSRSSVGAADGQSGRGPAKPTGQKTGPEQRAQVIELVEVVEGEASDRRGKK
jgi:hypothetical protein